MAASFEEWMTAAYGAVLRRVLDHQGAHLVRQAQEHDVRSGSRLVRRQLLEDQIRDALQIGVSGTKRLPHVVEGCHSRELDFGMHQEAPDHLSAAVARPPDDHCFETFHRGSGRYLNFPSIVTGRRTSAVLTSRRRR